MATEKNKPVEVVQPERLHYDPPRILSVEPLEAVAAVCSDTTPPFAFGKT